MKDTLPIWVEFLKTSKANKDQLKSIYESLPFKLLGVDSDNGGEFLNYFVYDWLKEKGIEWAPSKSDDIVK